MSTRSASRRPASSALPRAVVVLLVAALLVHLVLCFAPVPWAWILGGAAGGVARLWPRETWNAPRKVATFAFAGLAMVELGFAVAAGHAEAGAVHVPEPLRLDARLGTAASGGTQVDARRAVGDQPIYQVTYRIDARSRRAGPPAPAQHPEACVVFYGGSFTFGEGVEDHEAFPYRVEWQSGGRFRGVNLAMLGHGAHQMLARLERPDAAELDRCTPRLAIYGATVDHVRLATGRRSEDRRGPLYRLASEGRLEAWGFYENGPDADWSRGYGAWALGRSRWLRHRRAVDAERIAPGDLRAYVAIVEEARRAFEAQHPGARFHVLFWDDPLEPATPAVEAALEASGVPLHRVGDVLAGYRVDPWLWTLAPEVDAPNPAAHEEIALYVRRNLLAEASGPEEAGSLRTSR